MQFHALCGESLKSSYKHAALRGTEKSLWHFDEMSPESGTCVTPPLGKMLPSAFSDTFFFFFLIGGRGGGKGEDSAIPFIWFSYTPSGSYYIWSVSSPWKSILHMLKKVERTIIPKQCLSNHCHLVWFVAKQKVIHRQGDGSSYYSLSSV